MKVVSNWKKILIKSYSSLSILSNILIALSISGLSVLGILTSEFALTTILIIGIPLGVLGLIGRVIDQGLDDVREDCKREEHKDG